MLLSTYVVTSAADSGAGTLRDAITQADAAGSTITLIKFNIGAIGSAQTINLATALPALTANNVFINGLSQGGSGNTTPLVEINGGAIATTGATGLTLKGSNCTITGFLIENFDAFDGNGIEVAGNNDVIGGKAAGPVNVISNNNNTTFGTNAGIWVDSSATGTLVEGNYIGTDATGNNAAANYIGIVLLGSQSTIGGTVATARNIISGNANDGINLEGSGNVIEGNYLGTNAAGTSALSNADGIFDFGTNETIGGTSAGARNLISGNTFDGIGFNGVPLSGVVVQGNYIGTDPTGTKAVANGANGINAQAANVTIGGSVAGARNIISGNTKYGIDLFGSGIVVQGNYIGTNAAGTAALANSEGILLHGGSDTNDTIGGTTAGARNVLSGNTHVGLDIFGSAESVQGNFIGTDATGKSSLANGVGLYLDGSGNTIGGSVAGARNVISGNGGAVELSSSGNLLQGNYIGVDVTGANALGNTSFGVEILGANNTIGGTVAAARNVISANNSGLALQGSGELVQGNYIGTNAAGSAALGNTGSGISILGSGSTIGGTTAGARNVISANSGDGVGINNSAVKVLGNYIGTGSTGTKALGNGSYGIWDQGTGTTIGGVTAAARNIIAGNKSDGIYEDGASSLVEGNYIGIDSSGGKALGNSNGIEAITGGNTIGGISAGARNVISGNANDGVLLDAPGTDVVEGNYIGTNAAGSAAVANSIGIAVATSNQIIGGTVAGARNVISGNSGDGIEINGFSVSGVAVQGNYIGTDAKHSTALANGGYGVSIVGSFNTIGGSVGAAANIIANNGAGGIQVQSGSGNTLRHNALFANGSTHTGPGIVVFTGANGSLAAPVLSSATYNSTTQILTVKGTFTAPTANVPYVLEFFANPTGDAEGDIYLGSLTVTPTTAATTKFTFNKKTTVTGSDPLITATVTDSSGDTSAFSNGVTS